MPGISGFEFVEWLRKEYPEEYVPVILLTALGEIEDRVQGLDTGADDYLTKPFQPRELQARIESLLRTRELMSKLQRQNLELRELNSELSRMQEALVAKERELVAMQLAGAAAHNLRQPITAIMLNCHVIEQAAEKSPENVKKASKAIRKDCEYVNSILEKLSAANPNKTQSYVGNVQITDLSYGDEE